MLKVLRTKLYEVIRTLVKTKPGILFDSFALVLQANLTLVFFK